MTAFVGDADYRDDIPASAAPFSIKFAPEFSEEKSRRSQQRRRKSTV
ncbi:MAG: hypothetical protein JWO48_829 [Bryobacterales bacterium]|nr:hypothetical protein [Bryobacterales bacterium]